MHVKFGPIPGCPFKVLAKSVNAESANFIEHVGLKQEVYRSFINYHLAENLGICLRLQLIRSPIPIFFIQRLTIQQASLPILHYLTRNTLVLIMNNFAIRAAICCDFSLRIKVPLLLLNHLRSQQLIVQLYIRMIEIII